MQNSHEITEVTPQVSITNAKTGQHFADLTTQGYGAILCLDRSSMNSGHPSRPIHVEPCHLSNERNSPGLFDYAVDQLIGLVGEYKRVLVHCNAGCNRSVAVVAAYLCDTEGLPAGEALSRVAALRGGFDRVSDHLKELVLHRHAAE